jgi:hypothetical protein
MWKMSFWASQAGHLRMLQGHIIDGPACTWTEFDPNLTQI